MDQQLQCVFVANGDIHAHQVRSFLEGAGIQTAERGESLRKTYGLTSGSLAAVEILVAEADVGRARSLLESAETGKLRLADDAETSSTGEAARQPPDSNE